MSLNIKAVGDIAFLGKHQWQADNNVLGQIEHLFKNSDLVIGNLETVLGNTGEGLPGKCTLHSSQEWAIKLRRSGIHAVTLANNHIMDFGAKGLLATISALEEAGIQYFGAGQNEQEAAKPCIMQIKDTRVAMLGASSVYVSSPVNADKTRAGINKFDEENIRSQLETIRDSVDVIILGLHWGIEHYAYPSPSQIKLAHRLVGYGVDILLGHHPHVLQGVEDYHNGFIAYSLGNFVFNEFHWDYIDNQGKAISIFNNLSVENRKGIILDFSIKPKLNIKATASFTEINQQGCVISDSYNARIKGYKLLSKRLSLPLYNFFWFFYSLRMEWKLRFSTRYSFKTVIKKIWKIKPHHLKELLFKIKKSTELASEKTTNPYE